MREVGDIDDEDLKQAFHNYTQMMIDLALISSDLFSYDPKLKELVHTYEHRLNLMKKSKIF